MNTPPYRFFATTAKGIEPILDEELAQLGITDRKMTTAGVHFQGELVTALRACLWLRSASRVHLALGQFGVEDADSIYEAVGSIPWEEYMQPSATMAVDFNGQGAGISNTMFGAQRVKDAVVDRLRQRRGQRPSVDRERPAFLINCHLARNELHVHLDLSGESLHLRGYRQEAGLAPLKENLAAALLLKAGWPAIAKAGGAFLDPMCGSGTVVIEAAMIGADSAPGLYRSHWGFLGWTGYDRRVWQELLGEAQTRRETGLALLPPCQGFDQAGRLIEIAEQNAWRAHLEQRVKFEKRGLLAVKALPDLPPGLILTNPPYGKRLGETADLRQLYADLGDTLKSHFAGWQAAVFTGEPELGKRMGLKAHKVNAFYNGPLPCKLLQFDVKPERFVDRDGIDTEIARHRLDQAFSRGAEAFFNRIRKNRHHIGRWAKREGISCYRLYDADITEYAVAVDIYGEWVSVQEYAAPATVDALKAKERLEDIINILPQALECEADRIVLKKRWRQKGSSQYTKLDDQGRLQEVQEGQCRLLVNLTDYLDSGLFLDERLVRQMLGKLAAGKNFLNLFCYTGAATVHAALGAARSTTSVDLSMPYLEWAKKNLTLNGIRGQQHRLIQADCLEWISDCRERFDLIFLAPPTFSNSKRMDRTFDVQRDHVELIDETIRLLAPDGILVFSTNRQKFKLAEAALTDLTVEDISAKTLPHDFANNPKIHACWLIRRAVTRRNQPAN